MRLNRYIAACTKHSRRQADELIKQGRVKVNSHKMADLSYQVEPADEVSLDEKKLRPFKHVYYLVNKPCGVVVSKKDENAKHLIVDLVPKNPPVFPVGRLDKDSSGLIIMTNDGDLAQELSHPKFNHQKEYVVVLSDDLSDDQYKLLMSGVKLNEGLAVFDSFRKVKENIYKVVVHQGWNRQIRRMFSKVGNEVISLKRIRIAGVKLGGLPEGKWVKIEKEKLLSLIN